MTILSVLTFGIAITLWKIDNQAYVAWLWLTIAEVIFSDLAKLLGYLLKRM